MLVRLFFDAGCSWSSLYFYDVPAETVKRIKYLFKLSTLPRCWKEVVISEKDNVFEINVDFSTYVRFDCLKKSDDNRVVWRDRARQMNRDITAKTREGVIKEAQENIKYAKAQSCAQNFKTGKCSNPFVVENLGRVLLPHLYPNVKQK